jgi:hypothetical protein
MHSIIGIPPHIMTIGMPHAIILFIWSQQSFTMSMVMPSIGIIVQTMPRGVISQVILQVGICIMPAIIGIMLAIIGIIFGIMLAIIGIMFGIMLVIIGIMFGIMFGIILLFLRLVLPRDRKVSAVRGIVHSMNIVKV